MCVTGCREVETTQHLFFSCTIFRDLWHLVRDWIGVSGADLYILLTIFFSLLIQQVGRQHVDHLCNSFDFYVFAFCEINVTIDFLATRKTLLINC